MFRKIKNFFMRVTPSKRKLIQLYSALLYNANLKGFITGDIFKGDSKSICVPGMNCYSCPGAVGACPLGSIQAALAESKTKAPTYVLGIILLYCIIFGRTICGWLCPVGLLQELLYKIKTPKLKKNRVTRLLSYFKYVLLFVLVFAIPIIYGIQNLPFPAFCKYVCPAGTFEGAVFLVSNPNNNHFYAMLDVLFTWKFVIMMIFIVGAVFIYRFFCRFFCPLGALYGLFNKLSILGIKVDKSKCNHCQACITNCKMDVKEVGDHECINCGDCRKVCHCNAIEWKTIGKLIKEDETEEMNAIIASDVDLNETEAMDTTNEEIKLEEAPKKNKISKSRIIKWISAILAVILLIFTIIYANFIIKTEEEKVVGKIYDLEVTLADETKHNINESDKATFYYFYDELDLNSLSILDEYYNYLDSDKKEKFEIFAVSSYQNKDTNKVIFDSYGDTNISFAYDNKNKDGLANFTDNLSGSYYAMLDYLDFYEVGSKEIISKTTFLNALDAIEMGLAIGNKVGDVCINRDLGLIGSDETISVYENRGKITIINFWYTSCTPCIKELPYFSQIQEKYADDVKVIVVHDGFTYADNPKYVENFINKGKFASYKFTYAFDHTNDTIQSVYYNELGGSSTWPMTVIVDQTGVISLVKYDSATYEQLETEVERLLALE